MKKNKMFGVIQSFSRYEFKYILSKNKADKIENEIKHFMVLDKNAIKKANNKYFVRSLYFDNPINSNFYEKVDGMQIRKKFRIRSYSNYKNSNDTGFVFPWKFFYYIESKLLVLLKLLKNLMN